MSDWHYSETTVRSYELAADEYCQRTSSFERFPGLLNEVEAFAKLVAGRRVLELGVGAGRDFAVLEQSASTMIGGDACLAFLRRLQPDRAATNLDLRRLPFRSRSVGGIWCCATLLHLTVQDAREALREMARVLEIGSPAAISVKEGTQPSGFKGSDYLGERWFTYFTRSELRTLVTSSGLSLTNLAAREANGSTWLTALARA